MNFYVTNTLLLYVFTIHFVPLGSEKKCSIGNILGLPHGPQGHPRQGQGLHLEVQCCKAESR